MLHFLRRIRQRLLSGNKFAAYLAYAIGEIVLVVIGILIAIQVDNWNTARKQRELLRSYSVALINDLENDLKVINVSYNQVRRRTMFIDSLRRYTFNRQISELNGVDLDILASAGYRSYAWNRSTLTELKSSGVLRYVRNDSLSKAIVAYEAFTYHLDSDLESDDAFRNEAIAAKHGVVNSNYGSRHDWDFLPEDWFNSSLDSIPFPDYSSMPDYRYVRNLQIPLLTDKMSEVYAMVNKYAAVYNMYDDRVYEMQRARKMALELIAMLQKEFVADQ